MSFPAGTTSWTATEDVYIEYIHTTTDNADSNHIFVDNVKVSVADYWNANTWLQSFNGYVKAGSVIDCAYLAVKERFRVFPLL